MSATAAAAAAPQNPANPTSAPAEGGNQRGGPGGMRASGSLYVGDLQPDVTEAILFETFNQVGPVSSIRVCRDASSRISLGYAYVNFHNVVDAERALDTLNFTPIKGWPCRIMWSHRDPSARKNNNANIFIKNLDNTIDNKALYDTFSSYGNILSCKVALDGSMQSKGYAFVHFETEEAAEKAIEAVNGMMIGSKKVYAGKFERRQDRAGGSTSKYTNLYVKYLPEDWNEEKFKEVFSKFGNIDSLALPTDPSTGKNKGFGFVNFETHEEAARAKEEGSKVEGSEGKTLFVDRFQKRAERSSILHKRYEEQRRQKNERYKNLNLYVKNLEDDVDKDKLTEMFKEFGELSSVVVMTDDRGASRGFGFVCYTNPDDAGRALQAMNGKIIGTKPLYVNRAQRKEERRLQLESQFQASMMGRMQPMAPVFYAPPGNMVGQPGLMYPQQMMGRRYPAQPPMRGGYPPYPQPMKRDRRPQQGRPMQGRPPANPQGKFGRQNVPGRSYPRDQMAPMPLPTVAKMQPPQQDLSSLLANSPPEMQKQLLGERLFPLVHKERPELAGKITGMLLEMEVSDILPLTESHSELMARIEEAVNVLSASQAGAESTA